MAVVKGFRGILYTGRHSEVVAPPYDVIDPQMQRALYEKHPHNCVRLILSKEPGESRYADSARTFRDWLDKNILAMDEKPAVYTYFQDFESGGKKFTRKGFIARVRIEDFEKGVVLAHEQTFKKHKDDRLKLTRACEANMSQVFCVYSDPQMAVEKTLEAAGGEPVAEVDFDGVKNTVRRICDPDALSAVSGLMADKKLLIADGHHRYETSINYRNLRGGEGGSEYVMMFLCGAESEGLIVEPTHRVIRNFGEKPAGALAGALQNRFNCREIPPRGGEKLRGEEVMFVYGRGKKAIVFSPPDGWRNYKSMGVFTLRDIVIEKIIKEEMKLGEPDIHFTKSRDEVLDIAEADGGAACFIMPKPRIADIMDAADDGVRMPQKTTYFYPKILSGLVMNPLWD